MIREMQAYQDLGQKESLNSDFYWHENATFAVSRIFRELSNALKKKLDVSTVRR